MIKRTVKRLERLAAQQPVLVVFLVFVAATLIVVPASIPFWLDDPIDFLKEITAEMYGTLIDLLIIGWFLMWLSKRAERYMINRRYIEELEDFLGWESPEATHRIAGNIRRLNRGGVQEKIRLTEAYLYGANLSGAKLKQSDMWGANLGSALLGGADLRGANLAGSHMENTVLEQADLQGADMRGSNMKDADLERANLDGADLRGSDLLSADLQYASLVNANLERCTLIGANLRGANLQDANLAGCRFEGASLEGANLTGARLDDTEFMHVYMNGATLSQNGEIVQTFANVRSLYKARIDAGPAKKLREAHPHLFEDPKAKTSRDVER